MEVGRLTFIINRSVIEQPGKPAKRVEVRCDMHGFQDPTIHEGLALIQSMNLKAASLTSNILKAQGMNQEVKSISKNGG